MKKMGKLLTNPSEKQLYKQRISVSFGKRYEVCSKKQRHLAQYGLKKVTGRDDALVKLGRMNNC